VLEFFICHALGHLQEAPELQYLSSRVLDMAESPRNPKTPTSKRAVLDSSWNGRAVGINEESIARAKQAAVKQADKAHGARWPFST